MAYRMTAAQGTSGLGVLIALYDTLAGNLRRAAEAERAGDIDTRAREANHALLVIGHLEDWLTRGSEGELAQGLTAFYERLRQGLIQAQIRRSAEDMEDLMTRVLDLRESWQRVEAQGAQREPEIMPPAAAPNLLAAHGEYQRGSWSA